MNDKPKELETLTDEDQTLLERGSRFAAAGELDVFIREVLGEPSVASGKP